MIDLRFVKEEDLEKIRLIAIDIDGTLLNDDRVIPIENIDAIKKANNKNVKIVLSSGRPLSKVTINLYQELGLYTENNYFIAYNGESIYDVVSNKVIYNNPLDKKDVLRLDDYFRNIGINSARYVHLDENVTVINPNKYSLLEEEYNLKDHIEGNFLDITNLFAHKYQIADEPYIIKELFEKVPEWIKKDYDVVITMPCFLEFTKKGVCKYNSVLKLAKYLEIDEDKIMAIGDSMNDYSMVKNCAYGVAMGNAVDLVKDAAKIVTVTNNDCGVAKIIELVLMEKCR